MTKQEFEKLTGKYVDYETFELYEKMYNATELTKQEFVKLLDIEAIQEDSRITELRQDLLNDIATYDKKLQDAQDELKKWQEWETEDASSIVLMLVSSCKDNVKSIKEYLRYLKADLKALKP